MIALGSLQRSTKTETNHRGRDADLRETAFPQSKKPEANLSCLVPTFSNIYCCIRKGRNEKRPRIYLNFLSFAVSSG